MTPQQVLDPTSRPARGVLVLAAAGSAYLLAGRAAEGSALPLLLVLGVAGAAVAAYAGWRHRHDLAGVLATAGAVALVWLGVATVGW